jgi:DNA repair exonuclease SbcCD ATPase subunit
MEISRICVEGAGRFTQEAVIDGFGSGVNVLAAPNEAGKSTLFRALRACIFERHTSKSAAIRALETQGVSLPLSISVDFTHEGRSYRIAKTFLRSAKASLSVDGREVARNREADEAIWEIFGIEPLNNRSVDPATFAMLWVGQRESFRLPELTTAGENILGTAIEAEVGAVAGSERAKAILAETKVELAKYVTEKTGKPKVYGPFGRAEAEQEKCRQELEPLTARLQLLDEHFAKLEAHRAERVRLADPGVAAQQDMELGEARRELQTAKEAADKLAKLETEERRCQLQMESANAKHDQLKERAARIAAQRKRADALIGEIKHAAAEEKQLREQLTKSRAQIKDSESAEEADRERDGLLQQFADAAEKRRMHTGLERQAAHLGGIIERRVKATGELEACKVTAKTVRTLEAIERELSLLDAKLASSASTLSISLKSPDAVILIGARAAKHGETLPITSETMISLGDAAVLTLSPPEGFGETYESERATQTAKRDKLLASAGVASLDAARIILARRETLESQLQGLAAELSAIGVEPAAAEETLGELRRNIARSDAEIIGLLSSLSGDHPPSPAELDEERRAIAARREERWQQRKALDAACQETQQLLEDSLSRKGQLSGELESLRRDLAANLAVSPDESRDADIAAAAKDADAARAAHQQAAGALADMRGKTPPPEEIERLANKTARLEQASANRRDRLAELDRTMSNLEGQIQSAGGDGLGEKVAALEARLAEAEADSVRHRSRVAMLTLLADTISEALDESRDRFYAPIMRHLKPFVNDLFPGAALELGDGFQVSGLRRENGHGSAEDFMQLSDGTQEQIAVLVRLAMGSLLAEQGRSAPIILDDALVFSDDDRIARMFDALMRAGSKQQIIVLTCRMRAFESLGGRALKMIANGSG